MRSFVMCVALAFALAGAAGFPAQSQTQAPAPLPELPWAKDLAVLKEALPSFGGGRIAQLAPYVPAFETALANGKAYFPDGVTMDGKTYVLVDGPTENLRALIAAAVAAKKAGTPSTPTVAVANFYPLMALGLGSYYDETGKSEDAIRVLDEGLTLSVDPRRRWARMPAR